MAAVRWEGVGVVHPGRDVAAPAGLTAEVALGRVTALVGASGAGKSSAVDVLLGLRVPAAGRVVLVDVTGAAHDLADVDRGAWQRQVAWVPQRPVVVPGTLADNVRLVVPDATDAEFGRAAAPAGLHPVLADVPNGWSTPVGSGGLGLSAGQRQRLALARALVRVGRGAHLVVLDEPTAHLDAATEQVLLDAVARLRDAGCGVLLVAHRPALVAIADGVVEVASAGMAA